jgi:hypothetical protein
MDNSLTNELINAFGSPGETARVLSKSYYSLFYKGSKDYQTAIDILEYRNQTNSIINNYSMRDDLLKRIAEICFNQVSYVIISIVVFEDLVVQNNRIELTSKRNLFSVIINEHNNICPLEAIESTKINIELYQEIVTLIEKSLGLDTTFEFSEDYEWEPDYLNIKGKYIYDFKLKYGQIKYDKIRKRVNNSKKINRLIESSKIERKFLGADSILTHLHSIPYFIFSSGQTMLIAAIIIFEKWDYEVNSKYFMLNELRKKEELLKIYNLCSKSFI